MWQRCGVVRDEAGLRDALDRLGGLRDAAGRVDVRPSAEGWSDLAVALDLRAGLAMAEATLAGALRRRETRGCHNRSDFPTLDPALTVNLVSRFGGPGEAVAVEAEPVPPIPAELRRWTDDAPVIDASGRLLE